MKLNCPMGTVISCFMNFSSQLTSTPFIQFKILPHFLLRAKGFSHCNLLCFCLLVDPVPRDSDVTLRCAPPWLHVSLILGFHWLCPLIYTYRHKHTLGMESSGKQTLAVKGVTLQKKTAGPFPYPPLQDAISSHQPFHAHPLLETEDLH